MPSRKMRNLFKTNKIKYGVHMNEHHQNRKHEVEARAMKRKRDVIELTHCLDPYAVLELNDITQAILPSLIKRQKLL